MNMGLSSSFLDAQKQKKGWRRMWVRCCLLFVEAQKKKKNTMMNSLSCSVNAHKEDDYNSSSFINAHKEKKKTSHCLLYMYKKKCNNNKLKRKWKNLHTFMQQHSHVTTMFAGDNNNVRKQPLALKLFCSSTRHYKSLEKLVEALMAKGASSNINLNENLNENMDIENNSQLYVARIHATTTPPHNSNTCSFCLTPMQQQCLLVLALSLKRSATIAMAGLYGSSDDNGRSLWE